MERTKGRKAESERGGNRIDCIGLEKQGNGLGYPDFDNSSAPGNIRIGLPKVI